MTWLRKSRSAFTEILIVIAMLGILATILIPCTALAQTTTNASVTPTSVLSELESYLINNDTNYNGWTNVHFTLWEAAAFASEKGVAGESSIGNDLGLEIPLTLKSIPLHIDSATRFEQLFGDIAAQQFGVAYDYSVHQIQLSAGLDGRWIFTGSRLMAVPYIEFKKASTSLYGTAPFIRYSFPIQSKPGAGEADIGLSISF